MKLNILSQIVQQIFEQQKLIKKTTTIFLYINRFDNQQIQGKYIAIYVTLKYLIKYLSMIIRKLRIYQVIQGLINKRINHICKIDVLTDSGQAVKLNYHTNLQAIIIKYQNIYRIMSLPPQLLAKIKSIPMDPLALANNVQLAYMLSFSNYSVSSDSVQCTPKDTYNSTLETYNFADFDQNTYDTLYAETRKNYQLKNSTVVKSIRNSFKQFFTRVSAMTYITALKKDELLSAPSTTTLKIPTFEAQYKIDQMRGNNPVEWPRNLKQFHQQINKLPWNAFACQPQIYFEDFFNLAFQSLKNFIKKVNSDKKDQVLNDMSLAIQIILMISLKTNNQTFILSQLQQLRKIQIDKYFNEKQLTQLIAKLQAICMQIFDKIPINQEQQFHMPKKLWQKGSAFMIMKKIHFQRQNGLAFFSMTNDGTYLYIFISSINGGMYKVGTGRNGSIAGKIYLEREVSHAVGSKPDEINWVYLKDKLYLKSSARQPYLIQVLNPNNFKTQSIIEIKCHSFFGHQSLINLNRNSILMTDGHKLYMLGKQLRITQNKIERKQQQTKIVGEEQQSKNSKKKKNKKQKNQQQGEQNIKSNPQQIDKVLQFVLCQFEIDQVEKQQECDEKLAQQLFISFNNYFTIKQCKRALYITENDLSEAAQWLVDQGQKQRTTKILYPSNKTIIAQSEITSNFAQKNIKGTNQIIAKQNSMLVIQNVNQSIWTMDQDQITCFSQTGFKIFSKSSADSHNINETSTLKTTHLKTVTAKFNRNPQFTITYDPYNRIFYTFMWPTDGAHYFPAAVLIGSDHKHFAELSHQKKISLSQTDPKSFNQFPKWMLTKMNSSDNSHCPQHGRVNNWLWYYAQKIIELNKEINGNNDADKKKLTNKRAKYLNKMNKVNQYYRIYQKDKLEFQQKGKVISQIKIIPPFASDGSAQNLQLLRSVYGKQIHPDQVYDFIFSLDGWLSNCPKLPSARSRQILFKIRDQLIALKGKLNGNTLRKLNNLFIQNFFQFFETTSEQQEFITSLNSQQINYFIQKHHSSKYKTKKSIVYEVKNKEHILPKFESKNKLQQIFRATSNIALKQIYQNKSIGNLLSSKKDTQNKKQKKQLIKFFQKQILTGQNGIKLFQYVFLQAFRQIVKQRKFQQYAQELQQLFIQTFKLLLSVLSQANLNLIKTLSDPINQILQLFFASLCSFNSSVQIIQCLLKILEQLQKKQITNLFSCIQDMQFEGISQTNEKIYQTPHPIERGKNQSFPPLKNSEASLIYAQFDKRCISDTNHDNLSIQIMHENSPVGSYINCNDGVFVTVLKMTGKVDTSKPYLIMGNSISVDFVSSGHAKDAKSFGRFGFKFGLRPVYAGKIKYKKDGIAKIQKNFGSKFQFEKYITMLKLTTIIISNCIQNLIYLQRQDRQNQPTQKLLNATIFKEGYQEHLISKKLPNTQQYQNLIQKLFTDKLKQRTDGRLLIMKALHSDSNKRSQDKVESLKANKVQEDKSIWDLQGIPNYIKSYIQKIKNFSGDFIQVFIQARQLALPKGMYLIQHKKKGFTDQMKKLWLQGEAILFLTVLKHSGLLHLNIKFSIEYIKANLKAFQQTRNGIFQSFIMRMQSVREWRDLLQTFEDKPQQIQQQKKQKTQQQEKKNEKIGGIQIKKKGMATKTIKLQNKPKPVNKGDKKVQKKEQQENKQQQKLQKRKKQIEATIRQRLTQEDMIKPLCQLKKIEYVPKQTYENVTRIIACLQKQFKQKKNDNQSVYIEPIEHLIRSCIFLLKLKSSSAKQIVNNVQQDLEPQQIFRSYSQDPSYVNANKVNIFREWLQNWKKWKQFKKQDKVQIKFPVSQIIQFVNSWIPVQKFKSQIQFRTKIAQNRIKFYQLYNNLLKNTSNSFLNKYILGAQVANIKGSYNSGLESVSSSKLSELQSRYIQYSNNLKLQQQRKFKQLPLKLKQLQALLKAEPQSFLQSIKLTSLHLYLVESQNPNIDLNIAMFFIPLRYLSNTSQELIFIVSLLVQRAFMSNHSLSEVLACMWREIGNDTIACKRWRDYFFVQRMLFLLRKLENMARSRLDVGQKQSIAEILFHIIYHLEIPLICRISLRILSHLKIPLNRSINTPLSKSYRSITLAQNKQASQKQKAQLYKVVQFKSQNKQQFNNLEIIAKKCYQIFKGQFKNEIRERLLADANNSDKNVMEEKQDIKKEQNYTIIFNMNQEQDIVWMVTALYYLQQIQKTQVPIKDWQEYLQKKNKKKQHHKQKDREKQKQKERQANNAENQIILQRNVNNNSTVNPVSKKVIQQRILTNIPNQSSNINFSNIPDDIQANLPVGWFFNYCNVYNQQTKSISNSTIPATNNLNLQNVPNLAQKKGKNNNQPQNPNSARKAWACVQFMKLFKKFEDLTSKSIEQPKQQQSDEIKAEFVKAKNFISRIRKHCGQVSIIFSNLSQNGYYVFKQQVSKQKCQIICQLFTLASQNRLLSIPFDFKLKDYPTRLSPSYHHAPKKSQLKITCIKSQQYRRFNELINAPAGVTTRVQNNPLLYYTILGISQYTFEDKCHLPYQEFPQIQSKELDDDEDQLDIGVQFTKYFVQSSFSRMKKRHDEVYIKQYPKLRYRLSQGGLQSGLVQCTLVPTFDSSVTIQKASIQEIYSTPPKHQTDEDPQELLKKTIKLLNQKQFVQIQQKQHMIPYLLLSFYLQKLSKMSENMQFVSSDVLKQFEEKLSKFIIEKKLEANQSIQEYKEQIQVLTTKMLDSQNVNLSQFRLYRYESQVGAHQNISSFIDNEKLKTSLLQQKKQSVIETLQTHQFPKSNYLLPIHTPIPQQNKLLKYWEKNILPRIHEFVKSSLKQLQIDDFFQQMRMPLRKNDQLQAKKVAFVICDNKLPQGAVLPDASHNWNSLTIQDVTVGQDVLLRLPKSKYQSSSPLMCSQSQQYRVGQIMFIDLKNFSALVRHRLPQYAIFVYSWVPINSLQAVQQSLAHFSIQTIYRQLHQSFKGILYNYAKICLTAISKKIKISMQSLLQQTIIDMFRDNPISGWNQKKNWPLKQTLKVQLAQNSAKIVQMIQSKFCPIKSYDIDLFSQNIIKLNQFDNVLGLIVSFKKNATLIWYSGIKFYADQFGYREIANTYASKSCVNELNPLEFNSANVYCKYYSNKQFLKAAQQNRYQQKQISATIFGVDPAWTVSTYLANIIGQIGVQQNKYEDILTKLNKIFLKWVEKRQAIYLSTELCRLITKNTLRIKKIRTMKQQVITLENMGTCEEQLKSFYQWINLLKEQQDKDMLVLYSPLVQNLVEMVSSLLSGLDKSTLQTLNLPNYTYIQQVTRMIQMVSQIQNNLNGKRDKKQSMNNDTQWQRILVIQNIPQYINQKQLREKIKAVLIKNNGKILTPSYDIFCSKGKAVILVDSWDITELVEEQIMQKIQHEQQKQPENEQGGLMMEWSCQFCTLLNSAQNTHCMACDSPAPVVRQQVIFEKVETKDVNKAEEKLRQKQKKRFDNVKQQIKKIISQAWKNQCAKIDAAKQKQQKLKQQRKKKKGKNVEVVQQKIFQKPAEPIITLSSGSQVLQHKIVEQFLKLRFQDLPQSITKRIKCEENSTYLTKFKQLTKIGYDLWGDNISHQSPSLLNFQLLSQLMQYIQDQICKGSSSVLSYNQASIRMINQIPLLRDGHDQPLNFNTQNNIGVKLKYKRLSDQKSYNIRYSWRIIKELNLAASKCLAFINMSIVPNEGGQQIQSTNTIGANVKCLRQLIMGALKLELFQKIMQKTSVVIDVQDTPKISLQRLKIKQDSNKTSRLISLKDKDQFLFTKAHEQLQKISSINLRPFKPKGTQPYLSFSVNFKGELVQGQAGPYRQFFTDMSNELHPQFGLNMFIKTPNNIHKTGEGRSKWTINPKANSTYYLSLFHFLGRLMGCCIRTGLHMPLDLANFCWKLISDEKVKPSDIDELDHHFYQQNKQLIECPSESTFDCMQQVVGEPVTWTYITIDGQQEQLKPGGRTQRVSYHQRAKYVKAMQRRRIQQISIQVKKIRQGLYEMVPQSFLNHIAGQELKIMICGLPKVDVQLLKKHTKYAGDLNQESPTIKFFWQMLRQITEQQRLKLIRFCWGQQRLPLNSQQFERNGVRFMIKPMLNKQKPDQALPKADTCFFNIELPQYSSKEIMKKRIILAINTDNSSINGDRNIQPDDNPLMGNVDYEDGDGDEDEDDGEGGGGG